MTKFAGCVDELEVDLLQRLPLGVGQERFAQCKNTFLRSDATSTDHDEVIVDLSVVRETSDRGDGLLGQIVISRSIVLDDLAVLGVDSLSNTVDLLVDLRTMV